MSRAFLETLRFEIRYYRKRVSTWVYFGLFFSICFLWINAAGGAFPGFDPQMGGGLVKVNAPTNAAMVVTVFGMFGVIITAAMLGHSVLRDFEARIHSLFFAAPITRLSYLGGRFAGALLVNLLVLSSIPLGFMLGSVMPYLEADRFGPFRADAFLQPYLVMVVPTTIFTGALFFALAAFTRQMLPNYLGGMLLLVGNAMASHYASDMENRTVAALMDPFGAEAYTQLAKYWTPVEQNTLLAPFTGLLLWNRVLWVAVGLVVFGLVYWRFRFSFAAGEGGRGRAREVAEAAAPPAPVVVPSPSRSFGGRAWFAQYRFMTRQSLRGVLMNRYFAGILGAGLIWLTMAATWVGDMYGTKRWPVTYAVLDALGSQFALFMVILITLYAGELVWRERDHGMSQVHDATPVPTWVPFAAKLTTLGLMIVLLLATLLVAGVLTQALKGYFNFEIGLYLRQLFVFDLVNYLLLAVLVMLVHTLANHKYIGHLVVVFYFVFSGLMGRLGLEHALYRYNSGTEGIYSDMNGYAPFVGSWVALKSYWVAWALLLALVSNLFWIRGEETGARWRVHLARLRFSRPAVAGVAVACLLIVTLGGFVFYNTNVLNEYSTRDQRQAQSAEYERLYTRYRGIAQPRIVGVEVAVELYPERRDVEIRGSYRMQNKTTAPLDSLHLVLDDAVKLRQVRWSRAARRVHADDRHGYHIYRLDAPLQPGDSLTLDFEVAFVTEGFANIPGDLEVVQNGTFINNSMMPLIGYSEFGELQDDDIRRKHGLKPKERMPRVDDPVARRESFISTGADWIDFAATIGTSGDQIAMAPGYLKREWRKGDRRYFRYEMDAPMLNFYSIVSGRYAVRRDRWNDVAIEVLYHPGHEYNVDRMIDAVKKSLDYYTRNFGPYQHRQVRILEFPRYRNFAQSFANTIPYSEALGFIARVEDEEAIDYPFYITAHEVAHQWWGHQAVPAGVQGASMISESLSEYSSLMVMEKEYGPEHMRRFLEYGLDQYLMGRATERKKEMPLLLVENQQYIHYQKGSLVMYALKDYIGENRVNAALRRYLEKVRFQEPPYTNSLELYEELKAVTPDSLHGMLADMFERITIYDLRTKKPTHAKLPDGRYRVSIPVEARKSYADSTGAEVETRFADLVDVGVFAESKKGSKGLGAALYLRKHRLRPGAQTIEITVDRLPARAGIDPYHKLIDRIKDDNVESVKPAVEEKAGSR